MGFTATALIPGISAAGVTPEARRYTAIADAEVLLKGYSPRLPTAPEGYPSPVVISQAICQQLSIPIRVFDCGLPESLEEVFPVEADAPKTATVVSDVTADCLTSGAALPLDVVETLFEQGWHWGDRLSQHHSYVVIGECVAGGTTTALAILMGLGVAASGMVNSSHPVCNHKQKLALVTSGLDRLRQVYGHPSTQFSSAQLVAGVGDPMQPFVAGMLLRASQTVPVLLAGGTQMLAVYAVARQWAEDLHLSWEPMRVAVGTTRWVAEDPSGNSVGLARLLDPVPLLATRLSFSDSSFPQLQAYERGYVKEGVGAGGLAIAASLLARWSQPELLNAIEENYNSLLNANRHEGP